MKININAELPGREIADSFINQIKDSGIVLKEGSFSIKCIVHSEKQSKDVEIELDRIKFVLVQN